MKHLNNFEKHNEGTKIAGRAWRGGKGTHYTSGKNKELQQEALLHLFREQIGNKQIGFKMKTGLDQKLPLKYVLLEVKGEDKHNLLGDGRTFSGRKREFLQTFDFHFWAEEGEANDAPFAANKEHVVLHYSVKDDEFSLEGGQRCPRMNRKLANFLVKSANKLREMIVTAYLGKDFLQYDAAAYENEIASFKKSTKIKWSDFRCFDDNEGEFRIR